MDNSEVYYVRGDDTDTMRQPVLFETRKLAEQYAKMLHPDETPAQSRDRVKTRTVYGRTSNSKTDLT